MSNTQSRPLITPVAENILQVRLPLPFRLNHIYAYLLRERNGWTIVDFGLHWPDAEAAWRQVFDELEIAPSTIQQLVLTHMHPDHFGLAGWFQELCGQPILVSPIEVEQIKAIWIEHGWEPQKVLSWWSECGVPEKVSKEAAERVGYLRESTLPHPRELKVLEPGALLEMGGRQFRAIHASGHADGQLLFYDADDRLLLSGDQVLMKITPNIGLWPTSTQNPLQNYLNSLHDLKSLDVRLALPGHSALITDWAGRIVEIIAHHHQRLEQTLHAIQSPATVFSVAQSLFDVERLTAHEIRFALAETLSHLEYLVQQGTLEKTTDSPHRFIHR